MSQIAVIAITVVTEAPEFGQGDTEASPQPDPSASWITDNAAVAKAPPMRPRPPVNASACKVRPASSFAHHPVGLRLGSRAAKRNLECA
jgi:hypothetical protein